MNTEFMKGVVVPILTVIDGEEKIDEAGMRDQVEYVIQGGVSGILAFGSNGEFYMVEEDEMERGLKIMVDQSAGRVPVYFGIGAISTKKCCRLAQMAVKNGAAAVSVLQPTPSCIITLRPLQKVFPKRRFCCIIIPGGWATPSAHSWWKSWHTPCPTSWA